MKLKLNIFYLAYEDNDTKTTNDIDTKTTNDSDLAKIYSQQQFDTHTAQLRRKYEKQQGELIDELNALKTKTTLSEEERQDLDSRIEKLQNDLLTKEEIAQKQADKAKKDYDERIKNIETERNTWKDRYVSSRIERSITDAAVENKAFSPEQIVAIIGPRTTLESVLDDDGNHTGNFVEKVKFNDINKDGKPVTLSLTVVEAVKRMTEMEKYLNLFKSDSVSGIGQNNRKSGKDLDWIELAKDPARYRAVRQGKTNEN